MTVGERLGAPVFWFLHFFREEQARVFREAEATRSPQGEGNRPYHTSLYTREAGGRTMFAPMGDKASKAPLTELQKRLRVCAVFFAY